MLYDGTTLKLKSKSELGLLKMDVPEVQRTPWPMSPPVNQQQRIHVSINKQGILAQPASLSENIPGDDIDEQGSSFLDAQKLNINIVNQTVTPKASLDNDTLYDCKIIAQLQGNYQIETMTGSVHISVILPEVTEQDDQYAIVHRVDSDAKDLADQFIYEEPFWFTLNSASGNLLGVLRKGSNMKHSINWQNSGDDSYTIWRRKGKVEFNIVQVEPKVRRSSISSVRTVSTSPVVTSSVDTPMHGVDDNPLRIRPELLQQRAPLFFPLYPNGHYLPTTENMQPNFDSFGLGVPSVKSEQQQEELFELIKAQCSANPILFNKVVDWGVENNTELSMSEFETKSLSDGRLWVVAHTADKVDGEMIAGRLDGMKGAYQKVGDGMWQQPDPEACGSGVQHRLYKDHNLCWTMERFSADDGRWQLRAQELNDGEWVDFKNYRNKIRVYVIPMNSIFERMGKEALESRKSNLKKSMDFLFTACNQVKLSKLKGRNLKHHIANLRVKLEKRYALSLGVLVANAAESITQE